jgi:hypothetical protein
VVDHGFVSVVVLEDGLEATDGIASQFTLEKGVVVVLGLDGAVQLFARFPDDKCDENDGDNHLEDEGHEGNGGAL